MKNYVCSICGRKGVKLWRPYMGTEPLVCAECAEKRQAPRECNKVIWRKENGQHVGKVTDENISLPKWKINEKGTIPSAFGPGPEGEPESMTDQLSIDLSKDFKSYSSGRTSMVPACPDEDGDFGDILLFQKKCANGGMNCLQDNRQKEDAKPKKGLAFSFCVKNVAKFVKR